MAVFQQPDRGLTLLEVLIAVVLLALLAGALYSSYFTVLRARERAAEGMETRRELAETLDLLRRQIDAAQFTTGDKRLRFVVEDRDNFGTPASTLSLTTVDPRQIGLPRSGIMDVSYRLVQQDQRQTLTRQDRDVLLLESATVPSYPQMESISGFLVECYDGSKWVRSWDTAAQLNNKLPQKVRVTVQVKEEGRPVEFSVLAAPRVRQ